jgi:D-alanyl-D-alanine carboxypeptidase
MLRPFFAGSAALFLACAAPSFPDADVERFEDALAATQESQSAPGVMMIVADDTGHRWVGRAGNADISSERAVDEHTLTRTASIGKTFMGALILSLHEEGALSIDDVVSEHLDGIPSGDEITLRMLLQHTSGIANYTGVEAYREAAARYPEYVVTAEETIAFSVAEPLDFPPGTAWNYSNTGYLILGQIAEQIVGRPFEDEVRARFFEPLGMDDTRIVDAERPAELWIGYRETDTGQEVAPPGPGFAEDGGAWITSSEDLITWAQEFFAGRLHRPETLELAVMTAGGQLLDGVAASFGFVTGGYGAGLIAAHDENMGPLLAGAGNADGARTFVGYFPERGLAFTVAVNIGDGFVPLVETLSASRPLLDALRARDASL